MGSPAPAPGSRRSCQPERRLMLGWCGPSLSRQLPHAQPVCGNLFVVAAKEQIVFHSATAPRRYGRRLSSP